MEQETNSGACYVAVALSRHRYISHTTDTSPTNVESLRPHRLHENRRHHMVNIDSNFVGLFPITLRSPKQKILLFIEAAATLNQLHPYRVDAVKHVRLLVAN